MNLDTITNYANLFPIWLVILLMATLPNTPTPGTIIVLVGGCLLANKFGTAQAIIITLACLGIAFAWMYSLMLVFHPQKLYNWLVTRFPKILHLPKKSGWQLVFTVRFIPGCPLFVQTIVLGFLKAPFKEYIVGSVLTQCITVPIVIIGGQSAIKYISNPLVGISIFIALLVVMFVLNKLKGQLFDSTSR